MKLMNESQSMKVVTSNGSHYETPINHKSHGMTSITHTHAHTHTGINDSTMSNNCLVISQQTVKIEMLAVICCLSVVVWLCVPHLAVAGLASSKRSCCALNSSSLLCSNSRITLPSFSFTARCYGNMHLITNGEM